MPMQAPVRLNYFDGRLLSAADFRAEQNYHLGKRRLINRCLHGSGIVCGLEVTADASGAAVTISPGFALDCLGREVVLPDASSFALPVGSAGVWLLLRYRETAAGTSPTTDVGTDGTASADIVEGGALEWSADDPARGHRRRRGRWLCCGQDHPLPLARLVRTQVGWSVDTRFSAFLDTSRRAAYCSA
ncbi:hypothetical protein [Methylibium sp.]|uniref:hypothetical protein n=1 Tax=Methylibium sp. TaxID=2067992 RepID=UPI003D0F4F06